jgi:hypothetical protein
MSNRLHQQEPSGTRRRRALTAPVALIGAGGLVVWGIGVADAATGGGFVLGKVNKESSTATLTNSRGIPLSLKAKSGYPPLAVNSSKLVPHLNAAEVGGLTASKLQRRLTGGACPTGIGSVATTGAVTCAHDQLIYTSNGTFTVPAHVTHVTGELWGGGGGGGGNSDYGYASTAGGGAAGGFAEVLITVTPGQTYDVTVGAAGLGGTAGQVGGGAGDSAISRGGALVTAFGGSGGPPTGCHAGGTAGGQAAVQPTTNIRGLTAITGAAGGCGSGGAEYFVGSGGTPAGPFGAAYVGYAGQPGLVIISFSA